MARNNTGQPIIFRGCPRGVDLRPTPPGAPFEWLADAKNLIHEAGRMVVRPGFERSDSSTALNRFLSAYRVSFADAADWLLMQNFTGTVHQWYVWRASQSKTSVSGLTVTDSTPYRATYAVQPDGWIIVCAQAVQKCVTVSSAGATSVRPVGIEPPDISGWGDLFFTLFTGISATIDGVYDYRFTYYSNVASGGTGRESAPSDVTDSVVPSTASNGAVRINGFEASTDTTVNAIRIYRRRTGNSQIDTDGDGSVTNADRGDGIGATDTWHLVGTINNSPSVNANQTHQTGTTSTSVVLNSSASSTDDHYIGQKLRFYSGSANGQSRTITDYVGSTRTATVSPAFSPAPAAGGGDNYQIAWEDDGNSDVAIIWSGARRCPINNGQPPLSQYVVVGTDGRAYYVPYNTNTVYFSELREQGSTIPGMEYVGESSYFTLPTTLSERITGMVWFRGTLVVFTNMSMFLIDTSFLPEDPAITRHPSAPGCSGHWTIRTAVLQENGSDFLLWAHETGVYRFDGVNAICLTKRLMGENSIPYSTQPAIPWHRLALGWGVNTSYNTWYAATAAIDADQNWYVLTVNEVGGTYATWVYCIDHDSWWPWDMFGSSACGFLEQMRGGPTSGLASRGGLFFGKGTDGKVYRMDNLYARDYTDDTVEFGAQWITHRIRPALASRCTFLDFIAIFDTSSTGTIEPAVEIDWTVTYTSPAAGGDAQSITTAGDSKSEYMPVRLEVAAEAVRLKAVLGPSTGSTNNIELARRRLALIGMRLDWEPREPRYS